MVFVVFVCAEIKIPPVFSVLGWGTHSECPHCGHHPCQMAQELPSKPFLLICHADIMSSTPEIILAPATHFRRLLNRSQNILKHMPCLCARGLVGMRAEHGNKCGKQADGLRSFSHVVVTQALESVPRRVVRACFRVGQTIFFAKTQCAACACCARAVSDDIKRKPHICFSNFQKRAPSSQTSPF